MLVLNSINAAASSTSVAKSFIYTNSYGKPARFATFISKIASSGYLRYMNIKVVVEIDASYMVNVNVIVGPDTPINSVAIYYLAVQDTKLNDDYSIIVDIGQYSGNPNSWSTFNLGSYKTDDYLVGINNVYVYTDSVAPYIKTAFFEFRGSSLVSYEGLIIFYNMTCLNFRKWGCPKTSPYFIKNSTSDCIDVCATGYYGDNSTWNCQKCHYSCLTCKGGSTASFCASCDSGKKRTIDNKKCPCNSGYFDNGNDAACVACIANCSVCTNSTGCQTCSTNTFSITLFGDSITMSLTKNSQNLCIICSQKMTNCIQCTDNTICTKCYKDNDIWKVKADKTGCQCNTNNQYFPKSATECQKCSNLIVGCLTCTNNQTCSSCDSTNNFTSSGSTCVCKPGFILKLGKCELCHYSCSTCVGDVANCTACSTTSNRVSTPTANTCPCKTNYFETNLAVCATCLKVCATCSTATTCLSCTSNTNLTLNVDKCQCISNKYALINSDHCELCSSKITFCDTCTDHENCTLCQYQNYTVSADKKSCVCATSNQYFLNSSNSFCIKCTDLILGCTTCVDKSTCQTCDNTKNFVLSGSICKCKPGYFWSGTQCEQCHNSCLQCEISSTRCTKCSTAHNRITLPDSNNQCLCADKFYENSVASCPACLKVCATCSAGNTCIKCTQNTNLTLKNNNCSCISNEYAMINDEHCELCSVRINHCQTCSNYQTCTQCVNQNYTVSASTFQCVCSKSSQYFSNGTLSFCTKCPDIILNCQTCQEDVGTLQVLCQTCIGNYTTIPTKQQCQCDTINNYFPLGTRCPHCVDLIRGCVNCTSTTQCNLCFLPNNTMGSNNLTCDCDTVSQYHPWQSRCVLCPDLILGCINCSSNATCTICDSAGHFRLQGYICVCKDGFYLSGSVCLPCQVSCLTCVNTATFCLTCNNTALRTFSENRCDCMNPFSDCRSSGINQCQNHTCSLLTPVQIIISSIIKDPEQNKLTLQITFDPIFQEYDGFDFQSLLSIGFPESADLTYSYYNGVITILVNYYENLQGNQTQMTFFINQTEHWFFKLAPQSKLKYQIAPTNNLAANQYSDSIYDRQKALSTASIIIAALALVVYLVGLVSSKIIVSEMIAVMQIAYLGLFIIQYGDPYFYSLKNLEYSNGLNNLVPGALQQNSPNRVYFTGQASSVVSNINLMLALIVIPPVTSMIFYLIHKKSTKYRIKMQKYWKLILGEWSMTLFIFLLYNYSSSLAGFCLFTTTFNTDFYLSILEILILTTVFALLIYMFIIKDKIWMGEFKTCFNWNAFSGKYYLIPITQRFLIGITITAGSMSYVSAIIANCFLILSIIIILVKKPFVEKYQNYRSILTNIYSLAIFSLYIAYRINGPSKGESNYMYFPYIVIFILALNILTALIFIINSFVRKSKFKKIEKECEKDQDIEEQMHQDINRKIQEMIREAKSNNINNRLMNKLTKRELGQVTPSHHAGGNKYRALWGKVPQINGGKEEGKRKEEGEGEMEEEKE